MAIATKWTIAPGDTAIEGRLSKDLGVSDIMSRVLFNRGIQTGEAAKIFLYPSLGNLHNPFLLADMQKGVDRVCDAIGNDESIVIFGDYDVDGITSTAILFHFLRELEGRVSRYIPDRIREGYGLNKEAVESLKAAGASLIITVDCGISNYDEIAVASGLGVDTIVIDHHEIPEDLPPAVAVINQHRRDNEFPCKTLAGVGVAFNFLIALRSELRKRGFWNGGGYPNLKSYLDMVSLGTIGDMVPLVDENRILTKIGLSVMEEGARHGIKALATVSGIDNNDITSESAAFRLIPRLNAAGRVGIADDAVKLLLAESHEEALGIARRLDQLNRERQDIERTIFADLIKKIDSDKALSGGNSLVMSSSEWHPGVIGIVASKLVERYYRPTLLISIKDGIGRGSGRSIAEFNLYKGLDSTCSPLFLAFGGHQYAVGMTIREEDIEELTIRLSEAVRKSVGEEPPPIPVFVDAECRLSEIDYTVLSQLDMLAPFGNMNPEPILCTRNVEVISRTVVGNSHLRLSVNDNGTERECIWFNKGHLFGSLENARLDILYTPQVNRWRGGTSIQLKIRDARDVDQTRTL